MKLYIIRENETTLLSNVTVNYDTKYSVPSKFHQENLKEFHDISLPSFNKPLSIYISLIYDDILVCPKNTPNLFKSLKQLMYNSRIWEKLKFKRHILDGNEQKKTSFIITLHDELFDKTLIDDLLLSPKEQINLNNLKLSVVDSLEIVINIKNITDFEIQWKSGNAIQDLNFICFNIFLQLEGTMPLIFNYVSRSTYLSTKDIIPAVISSCLKSNETYLIEQRSILTGILKNLSECQSWIELVHSWDHKKVKREKAKQDAFSITWFSPS